MEKIISFKASPLPVKTWNYLKVNDTEISLPEKLKTDSKSIVKSISENIKITDSDKTLEEKVFGKEKLCNQLGENFENWFKNQDSEIKFVEVKKSEGAEKTFTHIVLNGENYCGLYIIKVDANAKGNILFDINSNDDKDGFVVISVLCLLEENAEFEISKAQLLGKNKVYVSNISSTQKESSQFFVNRINYGAKKSFVSLSTSLKGGKSNLESNLAYITKDEQTLDINDKAEHLGKKSVSNFNTQGVMLGASEKNYKGTIDLLLGCKGSVGDEMEDVLLLSDNVVNKTTPIILCAEEDVQGNHGATLGKIDDNLLFYMNTRGIDSTLAKQMIASGKLYKILSRVPDVNLIEKASEYLDSAFTK